MKARAFLEEQLIHLMYHSDQGVLMSPLVGLNFLLKWSALSRETHQAIL